MKKPLFSFIAVHFLSRVQNIKSLSSMKWLLSSKFLRRIQKLFFIKPLLSFMITLALALSPFSQAYTKKENIEYVNLLLRKKANESVALMDFVKSLSSVVPKEKQKEMQKFLIKEKAERLSVPKLKIKNNKMLVGKKDPVELDFKKAHKGIVLVNGKSVQVKGKSVAQIADQIKKVLNQKVSAFHLIHDLIFPKSEAVYSSAVVATTTIFIVGVMTAVFVNPTFKKVLKPWWSDRKHKKAIMERIRLLLENNSDFRLTSLTCDRHERLLSFDYQDVSDYVSSSSRVKKNISYKLVYESEKKQVKGGATPLAPKLEKVERYLNGNLFCNYYHSASNPYNQEKNRFQKVFESNQFICGGEEKIELSQYYKKNISDRNADYGVLYGSSPYLFLMNFCCGWKECRNEIQKHKNIKFVNRAKN